MPLLPCLTNSGPSTTLFGLRGATGGLPGISTLNVSSINVESSEIGLGNGEYISTIGNQLFYYNGTVLEPISALSSISTIEDWAYYPAISTIDADLQNVDNVSSLAANEVLANELLAATGFVSSFQANSAYISSLVCQDISTITLTAISTVHIISTISSATVEAVLGEFSTVVAENCVLKTALEFLPDPSTNIFFDAQPSTFIIGQQINNGIVNQITLDAQQGILLYDNGGGNADMRLSSGTLYVPGITSTPSLYVSSINGAEFTSTTITVELGQFSSIATQSISSIGAEIRQALMSSIVFSPSLNPSLGGVNVNLGLGGLLGNVAGWGAGVFGAAAGLVGLVTGVTALYQGRQSQQINNTYYEMINGTTQLQFSTLNVPFSTIYRFNSSADPQVVPGEEIFVSTVYPPGIAVRTLSDPIYTLSTPSSTIQAFGQWVPVPEQNPSSISTVQDWALFPALSTIAFNVGVPAVIQSGQPSDNIALKGDNIQLIGNYTDAKNLLLVSTISSAVIKGANDNVFFPTVIPGGSPGLKIEGANLFLSTPVVIHPGFFNGSTFTFNAGNIKGELGVSSVTASTLFAGALQTGQFQTVDIITLSSINWQAAGPLGSLDATMNIALGAGAPSPTSTAITVNADMSVGAYALIGQRVSTTAVTTSSMTAGVVSLTGPSTITLSTLNAAGAQAQPLGRLLITGNDLDLGQQDIWCQQIRLGAGNATNSQSEIIFYDANANTRALNTGLVDRTIRVVSTVNGTTGGYLLDTGINAPFFSTINQSTALMAFFPSSINSTIGVSTLSFVPPLTVAGSFYSSTSQTVAGANTQTSLTYNSQALNVGGFTYAGSTITVPVAGVYSITHSIQFATASGGTNKAQFYPLKNGAPVAQANSIVSIVNNGDTLGTIEILDQAAANDKYGVAIYSADTGMTATAIAAGATPAIPSIITNIKRIT